MHLQKWIDTILGSDIAIKSVIQQVFPSEIQDNPAKILTASKKMAPIRRTSIGTWKLKKYLKEEFFAYLQLSR